MSTLFPYTTLFRSPGSLIRALAALHRKVPAYSRQTGLACSSCHYQFPQLTPFGRQFKLNGYTLSGLQRSEEHTSELQSRFDPVCRLLLEKKKSMQPCIPIEIDQLLSAVATVVLRHALQAFEHDLDRDTATRHDDSY